jgi:hypothetical protein
MFCKTGNSKPFTSGSQSEGRRLLIVAQGITRVQAGSFGDVIIVVESVWGILALRQRVLIIMCRKRQFTQ